jgi:heme a synthase
MKNKLNHSTFRIMGITTVLAVYLLILVGGIVRSTGSGMGCPDWPKCFGSWVPPTEEAQLPENYKELYAQQRKQKNIKLASYLDFFGWSELSYKVAHDPAIYNEPTFNATKTWVEYVNRLVGAAIGILVFLTFIFSIRYYRTDRTVTYLSAFAVLLTGFQGWIGSVVVSTNLLPFLITIHMAIALIIVGLLIYVVARSQKETFVRSVPVTAAKIKGILVFLLAITTLQVLLGTQVREEVDALTALLGWGNRQGWVDQLGAAFYIHRSFSLLILAGHMYLAYVVYKTSRAFTWLIYSMGGLMLFLLLEIGSGIVLANFNLPPYAQPIHLLVANLAIGLQLIMLFVLSFKMKPASKEYKQVQLNF